MGGTGPWRGGGCRHCKEGQVSGDAGMGGTWGQVRGVKGGAGASEGKQQEPLEPSGRGRHGVCKQLGGGQIL